MMIRANKHMVNLDMCSEFYIHTRFILVKYRDATLSAIPFVSERACEEAYEKIVKGYQLGCTITILEGVVE